MSKRKKDDFVDDGRTVANMNVPGMRDYKTPEDRKHMEELRKLNLSKEEQRAIRRAGFKLMLKLIGLTTVFFGLMYIIMAVMLRLMGAQP